VVIQIKRYPNRKLYNTASKQYITLDEIAQIIKDGEVVQVVDNVSNEDMTALTLSQVILEQEKKQGGFLPRTILEGLIQAGGNTLDTVKRSISLPFDFFQHVNMEIERRVNELVKRGDLTEETGDYLRNQLVKLDIEDYDNAMTIDESVMKAVEERGIPSKNDLQQLISMIDELTEKVEQMDKVA
jgi:polyhydroxyalkanoate synthesis repressor PhaR